MRQRYIAISTYSTQNRRGQDWGASLKSTSLYTYWIMENRNNRMTSYRCNYCIIVTKTPPCTTIASYGIFWNIGEDGQRHHNNVTRECLHQCTEGSGNTHNQQNHQAGHSHNAIAEGPGVAPPSLTPKRLNANQQQLMGNGTSA